MYPEIYDMLGNRLAILKNAMDISIDYELNVWPTFKFSLSSTSPHLKYVKNENRLKYDNEFYVIKLAGSKRDAKGTIIYDYECPSIASDLNSKYNQVLGEVTIDGQLLPITNTASVLMDLILENTGWSKGTITVDPDKYRSIASEWESATKNLQDIAEKFDGYLSYHSDTRTVDLLANNVENPPESLDKGYIIKYSKNMTQISRTIDSMDFCTRLYCFGDKNDETYGYITINEIEGTPDHPAGQSYIQNYSYFLELGYTMDQINADIASRPNPEESPFVKVGVFKDPDYVDPRALYEDAKRKFDNELCKPKATYKVGLIDLSKLVDWDVTSLNIGDWVTVIDEDLGCNIKARVTKLTIYPEFPEKTSIEISNTKEKLSEILSKSIDYTGTLQQSVGVNNIVRNIISTVATSINSARGALSWKKDVLEAIELDANGIETGKRVRLTPGGLGITKDGGQTYSNAITGDGILANHIIVTNDIVLFTDDKYTRLRGDGLVVYDSVEESPTDQHKRVHLGHYGDGKYGLLINSGSIEIIGGLPDGQIANVSASKILGGTITASNAIYLGDTHFKLDALNRRLVITDNQSTPVERVVIGKEGYDYGLFLYNRYHELLFDGSTMELGHGLKIRTAASGARMEMDNLGLRAYNSLGEKTIEITSNGDVILNAGQIYWSGFNSIPYDYITGGPPIDADNTYETIGYNRLTKITSTGIYTGTIDASQIVTGNFTALNSIKLGNNNSSGKYLRLSTANNYDVVLTAYTADGISLEIGCAPYNSTELGAMDNFVIDASDVYIYNQVTLERVATQEWVNSNLIAKFG